MFRAIFSGQLPGKAKRSPAIFNVDNSTVNVCGVQNAAAIANKVAACCGDRGQLPLQWPAHHDKEILAAYAGGLNRQNIIAAIEAINSVSTGRYALDLETGARDQQDRFSIATCRSICGAVYGPYTP